MKLRTCIVHVDTCSIKKYGRWTVLLLCKFSFICMHEDIVKPRFLKLSVKLAGIVNLYVASDPVIQETISEGLKY